MADAYSPTFEQPAKGKYDVQGAFIALKGGSDAYLLENELSELQWIQVQERAKTLNGIFGGGVIPTFTKAKNLVSVVGTSSTNNKKIKIAHSIYLVAGHYFEIPETIIDLSGVRHNKYDVVYIDFTFKEITKNDIILKDGRVVRDKVTPAQQQVDNHIMDHRINVETSRRIQKQFCVNFVNEVDNANYSNLKNYFTNTNYTDWLNADSEIESKGNFVKIAVTNNTGNNIALTDDGFILGYPIAKIKRNYGSAITQDDIELLAEDVQGLNNEEFEQNTQQQISNLGELIANLENRLSDLQEETFWEKYHYTMDVVTAMYVGDSNFVETAITGYDMANTSDFVFQLTNMGNNYAAQIGETWSQYPVSMTQNPDTNKLKVYTSGTNNVMFMVNHFSKTNDDLAYKIINSAGNSTAVNIAWSNGFSKDVSSWSVQNNCIVCVQPVYNSNVTFSTIPSIGDIWIDDSDTTNLKVYNSGASAIQLQVFVLKLNSSNLQLNTFNCNGSNLVTNAFGNHYEFITTVATNFVMLGTPIKRSNQTTPPDIGEIYVVTGRNQYMVSTTSNGTGAYLKALVFKK